MLLSAIQTYNNTYNLSKASRFIIIAQKVFEDSQTILWIILSRVSQSQDFPCATEGQHNPTEAQQLISH